MINRKNITTLILVCILVSIPTYIYMSLKSDGLATADYLWIHQVTVENNVLRVQGSISDGAYYISKYVLNVENDVAYISIYQAVFKKVENPTPEIDYSYPIPPNINKVYLKGARNTLRELWSR